MSRMLFAADTAVASVPVKKAKAAPKKAAAKKGAKGAKKKAAKKEPARMDDTHDTARLQVFKLLKRNPDGLTGAVIAERLKLSGIPSFLKDEGMSSSPRIKREYIEGTRGATYSLTAAGKKAVDAGTINSGAPESMAGKEWK